MSQPAQAFEVALTQVPGLGPKNIRQLISYAGSAEAVFNMSAGKLLKVPGIGKHTVESILKHKNLDQALGLIKKAEDCGTRLITFTDSAYPRRLRRIPDFPPVLYCKGKENLQPERMVAIVGTRHATAYGKSVTAELVEGLQPYNPVIISGLAYGIDIAAHKAALQNNLPTIGVLASGTDIIYPAVHKAVAREMAESGALVSENPPGTKPDAHRFPARNRIIAGMADVVIVVEAATKGGALITAKLAQDYHREVMAVPGNLGQVYSEGCHKIIREHIAAICTSAEDVAYLLGWDKAGETEKKPALPPLDSFGEKEQKILLLLSENDFEMDLDDLCVQSGITVSEIASALLTLELQGLVSPQPGRRYRLKLAIPGRPHQASLF